VAIDAPLSLPHSVTCGLRDSPRCAPGQADDLTRDVDALADGMSTSRLAAIAFRGIYLARILRERVSL
jgi:predicted nuclease with RNAse H fold